jgi:hypothetical protein
MVVMKWLNGFFIYRLENIKMLWFCAQGASASGGDSKSLSTENIMITKEENQSLLERKIGELHLKGDTVVAFDFDELVVPTHLTKAVL